MAHGKWQMLLGYDAFSGAEGQRLFKLGNQPFRLPVRIRPSELGEAFITGF